MKEGSRRIRKILREKSHAIELAIKEVANLIWKRVKLLKDIDEKQSSNHFRRVTQAKRSHQLRIEPQDVYLTQALKVMLKNDATINDPLFIAQASAKSNTCNIG